MSPTVETNNPRPGGLLHLPPEIRRQIYHLVLSTTIIRAKHGELLRHENFDPQYLLGLKKTQSITWTISLASLPAPIEKLNLVCRTFNAEVGRSWHSKATYSFPSMLSFMDILSLWPTWKISSAKRMIIYSHGICYNRRSANSRDDSHSRSYYNDYVQPYHIPLLFPTLQLDLLVIVNDWTQHESGFEHLVSLCHDIHELIETFQGWEELWYVVSGMPFEGGPFGEGWEERFLSLKGASGTGNACAAQAGKWGDVKRRLMSDGRENSLEGWLKVDEEHDSAVHVVRGSGMKADKTCGNCGQTPCSGLRKSELEQKTKHQALVMEWVEKRKGTNLGEWLLHDGIYGYFDQDGYHKRSY